MLNHNQRAFIEPLRPRSFAGLMEVYEANYLRLRQLIPRLEGLEPMARSHVPGCMDLFLEVLAQHRYTSEIRLTYRFVDETPVVQLEPDVHIAICFDARTAEVLSRRGRYRPHTPDRDGDTLRERWRLNRFLFKWLGYCLHRGHRFHPAVELADG